MKRWFVAILLFLLLGGGLPALGQDAAAVLSTQWALLKKAQLDASNGVVKFVSLPDVRMAYAGLAAKAAADAQDFTNAVAPVSTLDSMAIVRIEAAQRRLIATVLRLAKELQDNRTLLQKGSVATESRTLEYGLRNLARQVHTFNYEVREQRGINLRFEDLSF